MRDKMVTGSNVKGNTLYKSNEQVFAILLKDRATKKNLFGVKAFRLLTT